MNIREWTLPVYTILIQLASGSLLVLWVVRTKGKLEYGADMMDRIIRYPLLIIFFTILTAMVGAHFHLSQPQISIMSVLNFQHSWLSREIVFNIIFFLSTAGLLDLIWYVPNRERSKNILAWTTILFSGITIYCMGRIYLLSTQPVWNTSATIVSFYSTTFLLGTTALPLMMLLDLKFAEVRSPKDLNVRLPILKKSFIWSSIVAIIAGVLIFGCNLFNIWRLRGGVEAAQTSLQLLFGLYGPLLVIWGLAILSGSGLLIYSISLMARQNRPANELVVPLYTSCLLVIVSQILGRILFYATHVRLGL
jgi:anaerobic dimethyl sulfoxide reductase subunit C (anchor subunit)